MYVETKEKTGISDIWTTYSRPLLKTHGLVHCEVGAVSVYVAKTQTN